MYQNEGLIWKAEYYECNFSWEDGKDDDFRKIEIRSSKELSFVWMEILNTDVLSLPAQSVFKYKLKGKAKVVNVNGKYEQFAPRMLILDGSSYVIQVCDGTKKNSFEYDNPEEYYSYYPDVDELQSFTELKRILKKRFGNMF